MRIKFLVLFIILITKCSPFSDSDHFFVESDEAQIPVYVTGNHQSKDMIVFVHGGPGDSSLYYAFLDPYQHLSEDYMIVYWDQRGSGISGGNASDESIRVSQFVQDTERVLITLKHLYSPENLILLGHSWGGALSASYLISNQNTVDMWIDVSGSHNIPEAMQQSRQWLINYAVAQTNSTTNSEKTREKWKNALNWYADNTNINISNYEHHKDYVYDAGGMMQDMDNLYNFIWENSLTMGFASPYNYISDTLNSERVKLLLDIEHFNLTQSLSNIQVPTLIIWGLNDGLIPRAFATNVYHNISTPSNQKHLVICSNSGHMPMYEEPDKFYEAVSSFITRYK